MQKKRERAAQLLQQSAELFRCPICHEAMSYQAYGLACGQRHRFDLSKKGTLYFLTKQVQTEYTSALFTHRRRLIQQGMYAPLLDYLAVQLANEVTLDIGCGEGSFLTELTKRGVTGTKIGLDLSKEGVYLASDQAISAAWCVGDVTQLPIQSASVETILALFAPSHYQEFRRVLTDSGKVVKVIPEAHYLKELRQAFYPNDEAKQNYSNQKVVDKFYQEMAVIEDQRLTFLFEIPPAYRLDLLEMSPLEWQVSPTIKAALQKNPLAQITIDVRVLIGQKNKTCN